MSISKGGVSSQWQPQGAKQHQGLQGWLPALSCPSVPVRPPDDEAPAAEGDAIDGNDAAAAAKGQHLQGGRTQPEKSNARHTQGS